MWYKGEHCPEAPEKTSDADLFDVKGPLEMEAAQIWFSNFCKANPGFASNLLTGITLAPVQEIIIRTWFKRNYNLMIAGRGFSKSFTVSIFIILYAIFFPGAKIGICSGTFRQSKLIFKQIEKFADGPKGTYLNQCVHKTRQHTPDAWELKIGTSVIVALPLTEKIRGYRFNLIIIDELLLVPTEIINNVIKPFMSVKQGGKEQEDVERAEDKLVAAGLITEQDRTKFPENKIIGLSSASYKFESLYKDNYLPYLEMIHDHKAKNVNHSILRFSYAAAPTWLIDQSAVSEAESTSSRAQFDREWRALFVDESGGFFSALKVEEASVSLGMQPMMTLVGHPDKKYILAIDPNYSDSEVSDNFAMCVMELDEETQVGTVVHCYALCKSDLEKRSEYLKYLMEKFNFVYIIMDNMGGPSFIDDAKVFLGGLPKNIYITEFDFTDDKTIYETKVRYNPGAGNMVHSQSFGLNGWLLSANNALQADIENRKIMFASKVGTNEDLHRVSGQNVPIDKLYFTLETVSGESKEKIMDFIDYQNILINQMKKEICMIEGKSNSAGHITFELPANVRGSKNPNRPRRDLYSVALMANWARRCYFRLREQVEEEEYDFTPSFYSAF